MQPNQDQYRIKVQLQEIQSTSFPFAIRISQKKNRTQICVQIYPLKNQFRQPIFTKPVKVYFSRQQKWQENDEPIYQNCQSKECFEFNEKNEDSLSHQEQQFVFEEQELVQKSILFNIMLYHGIYPYEAPLVTISNSCIFPGSGEFKDYFYDIMQVKSWWPTIKIKDILMRLPHFAFTLKKCYNQNSKLAEIGSYPYNYPFYIQDIKQHAKYFLVLQCKIKNKKSPAKKIFLALTTQYLLVLDKKNDLQGYLIDKKLRTNEIIKISYKKSSKSQETSIQLANESTLQIIIGNEIVKITTQQRYLAYFYLKYYEVIKMLSQLVESQPFQLIQTLNEFLQLADLINNGQATQWAARQLRELTKNFIAY